MSNPYDPTQPVPPPIESTERAEDLTPPPPPLIPAELPYFQEQRARQEKQRARRTRVAIIVLSVVAVLVVAVAVLAYLAQAPGGPTSGDYTAWLQQEHQQWQAQHQPVSYSAFADAGWQALTITTNAMAQSDASVLCTRTADDYVNRFHQEVTIHMNDENNTYVPFTCTESP